MTRQCICIFSTPPGQAPDWVREAWVGVIIPLSEPANVGHQRGALGGSPQNQNGYCVKGSDAIERLEGHNPEAAKWWKDNVPLENITHLVFSRDVCSIVEEEVIPS